MSTIRVGTLALADLLGDLVHTAATSPAPELLCSLLIHTGRGHLGGDPGKVDLLVGSSTNRVVAGHTYMLASGQWSNPAPMLWAVDDITVVLAALRKLCPNRKDTDHAVELCRDSRGITVAADPDLFGESTTLTFPVGAAEQYPTAMLFRALDHEPPELHTAPAAGGGTRVVPTLPRTDYTGGMWAPFVKVAARRGSAIRSYRYHQTGPQLVQIGDTYRGVILPWSYDDEATDGRYPDADLYPPPLSVAPSPLLRSAAGAHVSAGGDHQLAIELDEDGDPYASAGGGAP